jgi:hypothetical protein
VAHAQPVPITAAGPHRIFTGFPILPREGAPDAFLLAAQKLLFKPKHDLHLLRPRQIDSLNEVNHRNRRRVARDYQALEHVR